MKGRDTDLVLLFHLRRPVNGVAGFRIFGDADYPLALEQHRLKLVKSPLLSTRHELLHHLWLKTLLNGCH